MISGSNEKKIAFVKNYEDFIFERMQGDFLIELKYKASLQVCFSPITSGTFNRTLPHTRPCRQTARSPHTPFPHSSHFAVFTFLHLENARALEMCVAPQIPLAQQYSTCLQMTKGIRKILKSLYQRENYGVRMLQLSNVRHYQI